MIASWVREELEAAEFNDKRLTERAMKMTQALAEHSTASIPAACGGYAELAAAYRFCDNDKVTLELVIAPHVESTQRRIREQSIVLLGQQMGTIQPEDLARWSEALA